MPSIVWFQLQRIRNHEAQTAVQCTIFPAPSADLSPILKSLFVFSSFVVHTEDARLRRKRSMNLLIAIGVNKYYLQHLHTLHYIL